MAFVLADRVLETSTSTGTGSFVLAGARDGYQSFNDALANGDTTYYTITDGTAWEVGLGTWTQNTLTLARTTVLSSSNSGSAVNFGAGTKEVFISYPSGKFAEDTTAALLKSGGTMTGDLTFGDDVNATFGAGSDLQIRHEAAGNNSVIRESGTGNLYIDATSLLVRSRTFENMAKFYADSAVELYHNNSKKFETTSTGIDVTGEMQCDSIDVDGNIDLDTTSSGTAVSIESSNISTSTSGPNILLYRNNYSYATYPNTASGKISFASRHQYASFAHSEIAAVKVSGMVPGYDGYLAFRNTDATSTSMIERMRMSKDGIIINDSSDAGTDFRVESDSNTHMLFVDSSANAIGINNSSPSSALDVTGDVAVSGSVVSTVTINAQTGTTYTTVLADQSKLVTLDNASAITVTIPPNSSVAYPTGTKIDLLAKGAGQVTVAAGTGVTVNSSQSLKLRAQWSAASVVKLATDTWVLIGDLEAS